MIQRIQYSKILFLDIETVPQTDDWNLLSERTQALWEKKTAYQRNNNEISPEEFYHERAGIMAEFGKIVCISVGIVVKDSFIHIKSFYGHDEKKLLEDFLNYKRSCGYKYNSEEITLKSFYNYTKEHSLSSQGLTKEFLETWARLGIKEGRKSLSNRVSIIKGFAIYLNMIGYKAYVLKSIRNSKNKNFIPYVFTKEE